MKVRLTQSARAGALCLIATATCAVAQDAATSFVHPGGLHTKQDLDRMKAKVAAGEHPWIDGWNQLIADPKARNTYTAAPKANMGVSRQRAQDDATSAYLNALRWAISGDTSHADCAVRNLNGWAAAVKQVPSGTDQPGLGGIPIGTFAVAAELLRNYPGWPDADQAKFKAMLRTYFYPAVDDFLKNHRGTHPTNYWANWDAANILSLIAIGVYCDDRATFDQGIEYFKHGVGMGSIMNAVPFLYPGGLGQWQESGRDHAHAFGGQGLLAEACQIAWNQGVDLFGYADNRLLAGAEYEAQYAQWIGVPYTFYTNNNKANQQYISANYRGRLSNSEYYELLYNHYVVRKGLAAPNVKRFAELHRPEGGNVDLKGYGTLTYTLNADASPYPTAPAPAVPLNVAATAGLGRVDLKWPPSGAYTTRGYAVSRATQSGGPYTQIFSTIGNTTPAYTDTKVTPGMTYYYVVAALNQAGASGLSAEVSATPAAAGTLPKSWATADVGKTTVVGESTFADAAGGTFVIAGEGVGIGGSADGCHFAYQTLAGDQTITARLIEKSAKVQKVGLMIRESTAPDSKMLAMTLGEVGARQTRFATRAAAGGRTTTQLGNDYTWLPVWFRLQRKGDTITASQSPDGATWFEIGQSKLPMGNSLLIGLVASGGNEKGDLAKVTFDHVSVTSAPPKPPGVPKGFAAVVENGVVHLNWTAPAEEEADGTRIEASTDDRLFYEVADLGRGMTKFANTGIVGKRYYRVRAYNTGGFSAYSEVVAAEPSSVPKSVH